MYKYTFAEHRVEFSDNLYVQIYHEVDDYPETDYIGVFSRNWSSDAIHFAAEDKHNGVYSPYTPAYFVPATNVKYERKTLSKMGYSRHEAYTIANKRAHAECHRLLDYGDSWEFISIVAEVWYKGAHIGTASLSGIESDSDYDYINMVEAELTMEALHTAYASNPIINKETRRKVYPAMRKAIKQYETLARRESLEGRTSRWSKCPKQSGYAVWYTKNVQGE